MRAKITRTGAPAGALCIAMTGTALLSGAAPAEAKDTAVPLSLEDASLTVGQRVDASGRPGREFAGRTVVLEYRPRGGEWTRAATTTVDERGAYRVRYRLPRAGRLRAALAPPPGAAAAASTAPRSHERRVSVAPRVGIRARRLHITSGRRARVAGRVTTGRRGVPLSLQARRDGRWVKLDRARTRANGRFVLRDRVRRTGGSPVRVAVKPYAGLSNARRKVGKLRVYRVAQASWYGPGFYGQRTGCGSILRPGRLGVAHKTLPCGTKVTFRHRGRSVRVPVIDRGPYVAGREYDLTEAAAQRLRFRGHGPILATR